MRSTFMERNFYLIDRDFIGGVGSRYLTALAYAVRLARELGAELIGVSSSRLYTHHFTSLGDCAFEPNGEQQMWTSPLLYRVWASDRARAEQIVAEIGHRVIYDAERGGQPPLAQQAQDALAAKTF